MDFPPAPPIPWEQVSVGRVSESRRCRWGVGRGIGAGSCGPGRAMSA